MTTTNSSTMAYNKLWTRTDRNADRTGDRDRNQKLPFHLDKDAIIADLDAGPKGEKPEWILSSYGPGRDAPRQLLEGLLEQSPQEMRVMCYLAASENKLQDYIQHEEGLKAQAQQQAQTILHDLDSALKYVIDGEHVHPNRLDMVVKDSGKPASTTGGFGQPSQPSGGFGQPSQPSGSFGKPSSTSGGFGQPSSVGGSTSAFGGLPGLGQKPSPFGAPTQPAAMSGFVQAAKPAFGQPSQATSGPTFGAPSQPAAAGNAFGAASAMNAPKPSFGQPSQPAFGQSAFGQAPKSTFGAPSQPTGTSPFASSQPAQAQSNPFAANAGQASPFAQAAQSGPTVSPFAPPNVANGQVNGFGAPSGPAAANPFAAKPATSTFGAPSQPNGGSGGFGQPSAPTNGFGAAAPARTESISMFSPVQPSPTTNGASAFGGFGTPAANGNAAAAAVQANGTIVPGKQSTASYTTRGPDGKSLSAWKGQPVTYDREQTPWAPYFTNGQTGKQERVWHPDGAPDRPNPYAEAEPEIYVGDLGAVLKEVYDYVNQKEEFKDLVPEVPPKREWVRWDL
ncbi:hypothetical protein LTR10_003166 [Elasticomyces elasticus]|nr:hypothetical protein LTR10_003166 [Elasticomyces elasticus]KAK4969438.1 hypothetical protein LTR42_008708 [Elasticomyces elasticus]